MKKLRTIVLLLMAVTIASTLFAQQSPAKWSFTTKQVNDSVTDLILNCKLPSGWHIYSQKTKGTEMPIEFKFKKSNAYQRMGGVKEPRYLALYDKYAKDTTRYFQGNVTFHQKVKVKTDKDFKVNGVVTFQLCEKGSCIPPEDVKYAFSVKGNPNAKGVEKIVEQEETETATTTATTVSQTKPTTTQQSTEQEEDFKHRSFIAVFFISLVAGLLTLITPCVFPMIPMTISFFLKGNKTKRQGRRQAYFFGFSIVFIFAVLGLLLTLLLGKDAMYTISTHWIPNTLFFVIFMVFALSFFGLFEITMPSSWVNKSDQQSDKGGFLGSFFIALTTVLVSFSCTGPILGAALVEMASGSNNSFVFFVSMLGFAIGFALPFTLLAMFPNVIKNMKSGSWLNSVKIVFGFLELALGLKFLSMADLSANWGLLSRTTYLCLWIVIFLMLGFYLIGKLKFKGDSELKEISVIRLFLSIVSFSFAIYMIPGLWGAPLKTISGYLPPITTQEYNIEKIIVENGGTGTNTATIGDFPAQRKYADKLDSHVPLGFHAFFDLDEAKAYAKKVNKPLFIDFTGKSCANCREMETSVWTDVQVKKMLQNDYVMVCLFADENTINLDEKDWVKTSDGNIIKTLGRKNLNYQISAFHANAQPLYVLMDSNGNLLTKKPQPYDKNISNFVSFLQEGLTNFKK
ncbi:MAG: thioredoxin family protein [Bacteroidales bacterium]|jgi:thiol:disulfide interchange protein|nr:thioredoxin family protein [Bacteroidales bacterium]